MKFHKKTFKNGLRLITVPITGAPTATVMVMAQAGASYENKKNEGISHFLEHMAFKGTLRRPSSKEINSELDSIGSRSNAFTGHEYTFYYAKAHPKQVEKIIDVLSDIYLNSTFPEAEIEKEKGVIVEEMNMVEDSPQRLAPYLFLKLLYGDTPAGSNILGRKEIVKAIKRDDFLRYKNDHYLAEGTVVIVSGSFNNKKIEKLIEKSFASIPTIPKKGKVRVAESQSKPKILIKKKKTDQVHLVLGVRTWGAKDKRNTTLALLNTILGEGMSSRLWHRLREDLGICYYVRTEADEYTDHGYFAIYAGVDKDRVTEAVGAILEELRKIKSELVDEVELKKAKDFLSGTMYLGLESSDEIGAFYAIQEAIRGKLKTPQQLEKEIQKISSKEILRIAKEIFLNKKLNLAIVGDIKNPEKFSSILKI